MVRSLLAAVSLITRCPLGKFLPTERELQSCSNYFPVVGLLLGILLYWPSYYAIAWFSPSAGGFLVLLMLEAVSGGFHLDGLADTADAIYSARARERMLEIMRDSRLGTNGAIAVVFDLAFRFLGLYYLGYIFNKDIGLIFLILPVCGKMVQGILGYRAVYARENGLGLFIGTLRGKDVLICSLLGMIIVTIVCGVAGLAASVLVFLCIFLFRRYIERILGGITGDIMGAGNELAEILFLLFLYGMIPLL